jgi:hypothetical protein
MYSANRMLNGVEDNAQLLPRHQNRPPGHPLSVHPLEAIEACKEKDIAPLFKAGMTEDTEPLVIEPAMPTSSRGFVAGRRRGALKSAAPSPLSSAEEDIPPPSRVLCGGGYAKRPLGNKNRSAKFGANAILLVSKGRRSMAPKAHSPHLHHCRSSVCYTFLQEPVRDPLPKVYLAPPSGSVSCSSTPPRD